MENLDIAYAQRIAAEYNQKPASKRVALQKLDRRARRPSAIFAYTFGIAGTLLLGVGMCLCMGVIGQGLAAAMPLGIAAGLAGIAVVSVNAPLYRRMLARGKKKYAFEILELAREIAAEET